MKKLLDNINSPGDLKKIPVGDLPALAAEIREKIINVVSKTGGHLASSLGAVELAIALHYCFDMPKDKIVWDVGHQAYPHKILTGRAKNFDTLRQLGGISGFPSRTESEYDIFTCGHSSTSVSLALGLACARDLKNETGKMIAVIGDAALAGGMALEAFNHAGHLKKDLLVILNDNELSISRSVGALSRSLNKIIANPMYNRARRRMQIVVKSIPVFGFKAFKAAKRLEETLKNLLVPGIFFEELGFRYFGPINGHNINELISKFRNLTPLKAPMLVHVITKKGKGYRPAEEKPSLFHGVGPFEKSTGRSLRKKGRATFTEIFSDKITRLARGDKRIVAVTAAMPDGTGLAKFSGEFPNRFYDTGIAEGHAVTFSAGMARQGLKPVVAIYSTFLQRGYDQIIHDVGLQNLPVVFCIDRAGLVGEDGPTHHGIFDIAYLRHIPNLTLMAPRDGFELEAMLEFALNLNKPVAIRYPRGSSESRLPAATFHKIELGKAELLKDRRDLAIFAIGTMASTAVKVADLLNAVGINAAIINARFIKPLDGEMIENITKRIKRIVTLEEGVVTGGFGSAILEFLDKEKIKDVHTEVLGLPDQFIAHGRREELLKEYHLTAYEIAETIKREMFR